MTSVASSTDGRRSRTLKPAPAASQLKLSVQYGEGVVLSRSRVRSLVSAALPAGGEVAVRFVSEEEMRVLNRERRGKDAVADVLSFAYSDANLNGSSDGGVLGDIAVCPSFAAKSAEARGVNLESHLSHLVLHGALHLAGFRHDNAQSAAQMETKEVSVLARFGIADPYNLS